MKLIGISLIVVGIACFGFVASGLFAWTTPAPEAATPASLAGTLAAKMLLFSAVGALCSLGGIVALVLGIVKSRRAHLENEK
jgi:hypothetical protein